MYIYSTLDSAEFITTSTFDVSYGRVSSRKDTSTFYIYLGTVSSVKYTSTCEDSS